MRSLIEGNREGLRRVAADKHASRCKGASCAGAGDLSPEPRAGLATGHHPEAPETRGGGASQGRPALLPPFQGAVLLPKA